MAVGTDFDRFVECSIQSDHGAATHLQKLTNWYGYLAEDRPHFDESFMNRILRLGAGAEVRRTVARGILGRGIT